MTHVEVLVKVSFELSLLTELKGLEKNCQSVCNILHVTCWFDGMETDDTAAASDEIMTTKKYDAVDSAELCYPVSVQLGVAKIHLSHCYSLIVLSIIYLSD